MQDTLNCDLTPWSVMASSDSEVSEKGVTSEEQPAPESSRETPQPDQTAHPVDQLEAAEYEGFDPGAPPSPTGLSEEQIFRRLARQGGSHK